MRMFQDIMNISRHNEHFGSRHNENVTRSSNIQFMKLNSLCLRSDIWFMSELTYYLEPVSRRTDSIPDPRSRLLSASLPRDWPHSGGIHVLCLRHPTRRPDRLHPTRYLRTSNNIYVNVSIFCIWGDRAFLALWCHPNYHLAHFWPSKRWGKVVRVWWPDMFVLNYLNLNYLFI